MFNYLVKLGVWLWHLTLVNEKGEKKKGGGKKPQPKTEEIF